MPVLRRSIFGFPSAPSGTHGHLAVDTARDAPQDLCAPGEEPLRAEAHTYLLGPRSGVILLAR